MHHPQIIGLVVADKLDCRLHRRTNRHLAALASFPQEEVQWLTH